MFPSGFTQLFLSVLKCTENSGGVSLVLPPLPALQGGWVSLRVTLQWAYHIRVTEGLLRAASLLSDLLLTCYRLTQDELSMLPYLLP